MFRMPHFSRRWKYPKVLIALMILELGGTVAALALFGIAQPDLFRTKMWQIGFDNGFNSSPKQVLYAYANYEKIPKIPFVWTGSLTDFNVATSVLAMFILLVKVTMFILHIWYPLLSTITNTFITAMWIVSMYGQMGPDHSDPRYPSNIAWYISKSCSYAKPSGNEHYCLLAKGTFATTVIMAAIFAGNLALGIWSMIPSAAERAADKMDIDDMQDSPGGYDKYSDKLEMKNISRAQTVPYTPRTLAFNTLDRQLPLRSHQEESKSRWAS